MLKDPAMLRIARVLINVSELRHVPVDPNDAYYLEALGGPVTKRRVGCHRETGDYPVAPT